MLADYIGTIAAQMEKGSIPVISYASVRQHRDRLDGPLIHDPPGYVIIPRSKFALPPETIRTHKGITFAIMIPDAHWLGTDLHLLDFGPDGKTIILK